MSHARRRQNDGCEILSSRGDHFLEQVTKDGLPAPTELVGIARETPDLIAPEALGEGFQRIENDAGDQFQRVPPAWFGVVHENHLAAFADFAQKVVNDLVFHFIGHLVQQEITHDDVVGGFVKVEAVGMVCMGPWIGLEFTRGAVYLYPGPRR